MKKLFYILIIALFIFSCSKDDKKDSTTNNFSGYYNSVTENLTRASLKAELHKII